MPPPPVTHEGLQQHFNRMFPDTNVIQGEGHHLEYLIEAYQNGNPFDINEMNVPPFARPLRQDPLTLHDLTHFVGVGAIELVVTGESTNVNADKKSPAQHNQGSSKDRHLSLAHCMSSLASPDPLLTLARGGCSM